VVTAATYTASCTLLTLCTGESANVSGTKSGTGNNTDPIIFKWSEGSFASPVVNTNGTFSGTAQWCLGNTSTGALYALQFTKKANGAPNTFLGFARANDSYTSGQANTTNLNFTAIGSSATITGTVNAPPGYPTPTVRLIQQLGDSYVDLWQSDTTAIDAAFPLIATAGGNTLYVRSQLAGAGTSHYAQPLTGTTTVDFTMPAAAILTAPADEATGITTTTTFTWTPSPDVISQLSVSNGDAIFRIFTTKAEATVPVVPELALPSGGSMIWTVAAYAPYTDINEAAATNELEPVSATPDFTGPAHAYAISLTRRFTAQ
jgi:hypothetical protein